ncbi:hypothetical protein Agau_P200160 (plasmid) [Agrobacterium tumefaciens F2]|nr:hypothetical protein Agau_P200160 [Agrobacterium tumefaciens F2]
MDGSSQYSRTDGMPSGWRAATFITVMNRSGATDSKLSLDEV